MSFIKAFEFLSKHDVLLASGSPRRRELIQKLRLNRLFYLSIPESVENLLHGNFADPRSYVLANVKNKLDYALENISQKSPAVEYNASTANKESLESLLIAADTIVVDGKEILEKPKSPADNFRMTKQLSGRSHKVITAVSFTIPERSVPKTGEQCNSFISPKKTTDNMDSTNSHTFAVETLVNIIQLDDEMVQWYVDTQEGRDKAGGYAIQGHGAALVGSIDGCFYNVVGFPVNRFLLELNQYINRLEIS